MDVAVPWCGIGDPWTVRIGCGCGKDFRDCSQIRIRMGPAHLHIGSSRRISFRKRVAHIRHRPQRPPRRHSEQEPEHFHVSNVNRIELKLNEFNSLTHHKRSLHVERCKVRLRISCRTTPTSFIPATLFGHVFFFLYFPLVIFSFRGQSCYLQ